ncbi:MAG: hypothetical protein ACM34I_05535 [bacterium]
MTETKRHKKPIEEIIDGLQCPKAFRCYTSGFTTLCRSMDIGLESHLVCLEKNGRECTFSVRFGDTFFCQCPLRVYIGKKLKK